MCRVNSYKANYRHSVDTIIIIIIIVKQCSDNNNNINNNNNRSKQSTDIITIIRQVKPLCLLLIKYNIIIIQ
jgi:hypothetical protein